MPVFKPFKAFRPTASFAKSLACRPFDVVSQSEADSENEQGLSQFLKVTKPELFYSELTDEQRHAKSFEVLQKLINEKVLVQDGDECFYLYGQTIGERSQYGLMGCLSTDDYKNGLIKQHELTRVEKVSDRSEHISNTGFHTEPVFTAIKDNFDIDLIIKDVVLIEPEYSFVTSDSVTHQFWVIDNGAKVRYLQKIFVDSVDAVYIADGHHRSAAASVVANDSTKTEASLFLATVFPMNQLDLKGYHRIADLGDVSQEDFISRLSENFLVETVDSECFPSNQSEMGMLLNNVWYKLRLKDLPSTPFEMASYFNKYVAKEILGVENIRSTSKIQYAGGKRQIESYLSGESKLENKAFFTLSPLTVKLLFQLADEGVLLPPKSTWFEPKLRSGLCLHSLS